VRTRTIISVVEDTIRVMPYISEEPKFIRERYILVAAIVTMTILGNWGICVVERRKESIT